MPTHSVDEEQTWAKILPENLPEWLARDGAEFFARQRWYGAKGSRITAIKTLDCALLPNSSRMTGGAIFALCLAEIHAAAGAETYFLPLALAPADAELPESCILAEIQGRRDRRRLADALFLPGFRESWLSWLLSGGSLPGRKGIFAARAPQGGDHSTDHAEDKDTTSGMASSRLAGVEQSNSSLIYADARQKPRLMLKIFRRIAAGLNPDYEITVFLSAGGQFPNLAAWRGGVEYLADETEPRVLAMAQDYIANQGDGWNWLLGRLLAAEEPASLAQTALPELRRLGEITGAMHIALASDHTTPAFAPQPFNSEFAAEWASELKSLTRSVADELRARMHTLDAETRRMAEAVLPRLELPASALNADLPLELIRIHGDYHLGQALRTETDFTIIDFEGEPARPSTQRRRKNLALKDVAGMLRSLDYAATAAARQQTKGQASESALRQWNHAAREAFWSGYRQQLQKISAEKNRAQAHLLPTSPAQAQAVLDAFEWEKAVYELGYELRNRPDWAALPLAGLHRLAGSPTFFHSRFSSSKLFYS